MEATTYFNFRGRVPHLHTLISKIFAKPDKVTLDNQHTSADKELYQARAANQVPKSTIKPGDKRKSSSTKKTMQDYLYGKLTYSKKRFRVASDSE